MNRIFCHKLSSANVYSYFIPVLEKEPTNQNSTSNKNFVLIGQYGSANTKIVFKHLMIVNGGYAVL